MTAHQEQETGRQERAYKRTASTQELCEFWSLKETSSENRDWTQEFSERLKETAGKDTEKQSKLQMLQEIAECLQQKSEI